ncbi:MAG: heme exporter protein CcmB [Chitinophagaceae bacterium]|jgi:heme exporter protein B|nr:heme exporter protein CcmB [Chitinophagaceae bacterium]
MRNVLTLFRKDLLLELRQQYAVYGVLLYIVSTVFVLFLSVGQTEPDTWNALFWVMQLFVCINAVAKSFLQDSRGRMLYYYTVTSPTAYILSKILYNLVLMSLLNFLTLILYIAFMGDPSFRLDIFIAISFLGSIGLSLVFTMLAAIASKAMQQASLMAILGFPVIIPQLLLLIRLSKLAFAETFQAGVPLQVVGLLLALDASVVVLALILFPFLWKD